MTAPTACDRRPWALRAWLAAVIAAAALATPLARGDEPAPPAVLGQLDGLAAQRPGVIDVYAVVVGAYGNEEVFRKEAAAVRDALDRRLDTAGRSVTLVNHRGAPQPEATLDSLGYALKRVAGRMDRDEDVLFLHIASHGSADHVLSFRHPARELQGLTPGRLAALLDETRVRHRVIVISACYSGGFVPQLANAGTLVITAADRASKSYGCGNDSEITDFSRAFYLKALRQTRSLIEAARLAQSVTHAEERALKRPHSYPQLRAGASIEDRLRALERELGARRPALAH